VRLRLAVIVAAAAVLFAGCQPGTVRISYRPPVGSEYRYRVEVHSVTITRLGEAPVERVEEDVVLEADDTVLTSGPDGVRVRVRLRRPDSPERTYVVRLNRAAQLAGVEAIEGLPPSALGPDALPEILPGAPGAPPTRPLKPGERWTIDAGLSLPGAQAGRLQGSGTLVELGLLDGREVATTRSVTRLPLRSNAPFRGGTLALDGIERTETSATRTLADGAVETSSSVSRAEFAITLAPRVPGEGAPVTGTLSIEVQSETVRLRP
jgi:hypothetical protein